MCRATYTLDGASWLTAGEHCVLCVCVCVCVGVGVGVGVGVCVWVCVCGPPCDVVSKVGRFATNLKF